MTVSLEVFDETLAFDWPAPEGYYFPDPAESPQGCIVRYSDNQDAPGFLLSIDPDTHTAVVDGVRGPGVRYLPLASIKLIRLTTPVPMRRIRSILFGDTLHAFEPGEKRSFKVRFRDGEIFEGETVGVVDARDGYFLFIDHQNSGSVQRVFVSENSVAMWQLSTPPLPQADDRPMRNPKMASLFRQDQRKYPFALQERFERILNRIAELWENPDLERYFMELVIDTRGNRQGFPQDVLKDILRLQLMWLEGRSNT